MIDASWVPMGLAILAALAALALRLRGRRLPGRRLTTVLLLLALAVAALRIEALSPRRTPARDVGVYLLDLSYSAAADVRDLLAPWPRYPNEWRDFDEVIVVGFHLKAAVLAAGRPAAIEERLALPDEMDAAALRDGADFAAAWRLAAARLRASDRVRVLVASDGGFDEAAATAALRARGAGNIASVVVAPFGGPVTEDAGVRIVETPLDARAGTEPALGVVVFGSVRVPRRVRVLIDGGDAALVDLTPASRQVFAALRPAPLKDGVNVVTARIEGVAGFDRDPMNDADSCVVTCRGERRSLVLATASSASAADIQQMLGDRFAVRVVAPHEILNPAAFDGADVAIIADLPRGNVARQRFGEAAADFVFAGGGLLLLGCDGAFGAGDWNGTALDRVSPLKARPDDAPMSVRVALDRSGSMARDGRWRHAAAAVAALAERLSEGDELRVVSFAGDVEVAVYPGGADAVRVEADLLSIAPSGGTDLNRAMRRVLDGGVEEGRRSVVLVLSDMESPTFTPEALAAWIEAAIAGRRQVYLLWFERDEARRPLLMALAAATGGAVIDVDDMSHMVRPLIEAASFGLEVGPVMIEDVGGAVTIARMLRTRTAPGALVLRNSASGAVLARWRQGRGSVGAAPIAATAAAIAAAFGGEEGFAAHLEGLPDERAATDLHSVVEADAGGHRRRIVGLDAPAGTKLRLSSGGAAVDLQRCSADAWIAPLHASSSARFGLVAGVDGQPVARVHLPPPVFADSSPGRPADAGILARAGAERSSLADPTRRHDAWLAFAFVLLLADVVLRLLRR